MNETSLSDSVMLGDWKRGVAVLWTVTRWSLTPSPFYPLIPPHPFLCCPLPPCPLTLCGQVVSDKQREVRAGHDGSWVAHPALVAVALQQYNAFMPQCNQLFRSGCL